MTQYVFTLTSRMVAIASACLFFLGILLFLLGVELGKLWVGSGSVTKAPVAVSDRSQADSSNHTEVRSEISSEPANAKTRSTP